IGNAQPFVFDFEGFPVVTPAVTVLTGNIYRREKIHLYAHGPFAGANFTAPARRAKKKPPGVIAPHSRFRQLREKMTQMIEDTGIGCRVRSGRAANRYLVDTDNPIEKVSAY